MKLKVVQVPSTKKLIQPSPGFAKKELATRHLELMALCNFGCAYCSSNSGNFLRINRDKFAQMTEEQLGARYFPSDTPELTFEWADVIDKLDAETKRLPKDFGAGETLVFSQLTDAFSPRAVASGITRKALELLVERTSLRIRVLTKSAVVGTDRCIEFFQAHPGRFVVGLSIGTMDDEWARRVEIGTSSPTARLKALRALQDAGVPTYGMLCPIFPDVLGSGAAPLAELVAAIRPEQCETVWAEPFNDRDNWRAVQAGYQPDTPVHEWFRLAFGSGSTVEWSRYATLLYTHLRRIGERDGWFHKLRYLLYEDGIAGPDAPSFRRLEGVLLQSKPIDEGPSKGRSRNPAIARLQAMAFNG